MTVNLFGWLIASKKAETCKTDELRAATRSEVSNMKTTINMKYHHLTLLVDEALSQMGPHSANVHHTNDNRHKT